MRFEEREVERERKRKLLNKRERKVNKKLTNPEVNKYEN